MNQEASKPPQRRFKGVWICASLWTHPDLNPTEKFVIAEVDSLCGKDEETGEEHACFAGNDHFANHLQVSSTHMRDMLANLTSLGYVIRLAFTGRITFRCVKPEFSSDPLFSARLINRYRKNPISDIGQVRDQGSEKPETENPKLVTKRETTKTKKVVAASSASPEEKRFRNWMTQLADEFGLSKAQLKTVESYVPVPGEPYIEEKAAITRSEKRDNAGGFFMKALRDDYKPRKRIEKQKAENRPVQGELIPQQDLTEEQRAENIAKLRAARQAAKDAK